MIETDNVDETDAAAQCAPKRSCLGAGVEGGDPAGTGMLEHLLVVRAGKSIAEKRRDELVEAGYRFVNVTSRSGDASRLGGAAGSAYVRLSPFFPVGGVPLPEGVGGVCGRTHSESVEGLWQGLKIIDGKTDFGKFGVTSMKKLKRSARGKTVGGHFVGEGKEPLGYLAARREIYVPAYLLQLEQMRDVVETLRAEATQHKVALVDYTDAEWDDLRKPLSHACVLRHVLLGRDPLARGAASCAEP
jgi:hypothetical protein